MCKKNEMKQEDMEQISGGVMTPDGPGVINPSVEPILPELDLKKKEIFIPGKIVPVDVLTKKK